MSLYNVFALHSVVRWSEENSSLSCASSFISQVKLEARSSELASQRIALEEERLVREEREGRPGDSEAEQLRSRLREQVGSVPVWYVICGV